MTTEFSVCGECKTNGCTECTCNQVCERDVDGSWEAAMYESQFGDREVQPLKSAAKPAPVSYDALPNLDALDLTALLSR